MRVIKFRAWHQVEGERGQMVYFGLFGTDQGYHIHSQCSLDECPVMQFTGLLDKSGVEIYESDRLLSKGESDHDDSKFTVIFAEGEWKIRYDDDPTVRLGLYNFGLRRLEVVGNIYENGEPLEAK